MARPFKSRTVSSLPFADHFKPRGIPLTELEEVVLSLDEYEALRLADHEGLYQEDACVQMGISRATFGNILTCARRKVAEALVGGKAIKIEGGNYSMNNQHRKRQRGRCGRKNTSTESSPVEVPVDNSGRESAQRCRRRMRCRKGGK